MQGTMPTRVAACQHCGNIAETLAVLRCPVCDAPTVTVAYAEALTWRRALTVPRMTAKRNAKLDALLAAIDDALVIMPIPSRPRPGSGDRTVPIARSTGDAVHSV
jgi:hypothetical protein